MTSQSGAAAAWDAEYAAGRYSGEPPVAFTGDILAAAGQAGLARGLYIGCGNGRNYLPLVAGGQGKAFSNLLYGTWPVGLARIARATVTGIGAQ